MRLLRTAVGRLAPRRMPWHILVAALALTAVGVAFVRSAAGPALAQRHAVFASAGVVAFLALALLDYRLLSAVSPVLYLGGLGSLAVLFFVGIRLNSAVRWYDLGPVHLQPSEPMKYILVIALAEYFRQHRTPTRARELLGPMLLCGAPMLLIILQPDLGTAMVMAPLFFAMSFFAGVPVRNLLIVAVAGAVLAAGAWCTPGVLKPYQRERVNVFLGRSADPRSAVAYNAEQAALAIAAGGMDGQGWGQGMLTRLERIPEQYADFIFPVIAEEWGFVRTAPLVLCFLALTVLLADLARRTRERFGRLIVAGVMTLFAVQSFLHFAISLRLAPITGLTLPFVSYGGSSLVSTYAAFGLVASVRMHRRDFFEPNETED